MLKTRRNNLKRSVLNIEETDRIVKLKNGRRKKMLDNKDVLILIFKVDLKRVSSVKKEKSKQF